MDDRFEQRTDFVVWVIIFKSKLKTFSAPPYRDGIFEIVTVVFVLYIGHKNK